MKFNPAIFDYNCIDFSWNSDSSIEFVSKFGTTGSGDGQFNGPVGIAIGGKYLYVADNTNNNIQKFQLDGTFVSKFGSGGSGGGQFSGIESLTITPDGQYLLIADAGNTRIQKLQLDGTFVSKVSTAGYPTYVRQYGDIIYVSTLANTISKYDTSLSLLGSFGAINAPTGISFNSTHIFICEYGLHQWKKYTMAESLVNTYGGSGSGDGKFSGPVGIQVIGNYVYISDRNNHRIQKFTLDGTFVSKFGSSGSGDGQFNQPYHFTNQNTRLFIADFGNDRVQSVKFW